MEAILNKIPNTDAVTWRSLYLCSHQPRFWDMVTFHTGETTPTDTPVLVSALAKEWLLPSRYRHYLLRQLGPETKVRPHQALAVLAQTDYDRHQLRDLVCEDIQRQLLLQGVFGVRLVDEANLSLDETVTSRYHVYRIGLRKLILPGMVNLDLPALRSRFQGYELVTKLEFCYFRQIIEPFYRRYLITSFPGWTEPIPLITLGNVLLATPEDEAHRRWRESLLSAMRSLLAKHCSRLIGPEVLIHILHREEERLFLRDLVIRTFTEQGVNDHYLIMTLKERYRL